MASISPQLRLSFHVGIIPNWGVSDCSRNLSLLFELIPQKIYSFCGLWSRQNPEILTVERRVNSKCVRRWSLWRGNMWSLKSVLFQIWGRLLTWQREVPRSWEQSDNVGGTGNNTNNNEILLSQRALYIVIAGLYDLSANIFIEILR